MPTPTYTPLATVTLGSSASTVNFSSIPATYRDLVIIAIPISTSGISETGIRFNSDSGNNYNRVLMFGTGSTTGSFANTGVSYLGFVDGYTTSVGNSGIAQVMDYSATDKHKTILARKNEPTDALAAIAGRWANTVAITSVSLNALGGGNQFASGSTFALYGIAS